MQTTVNTQLPIGLEGQVVDIYNSDIISSINSSKQTETIVITTASSSELFRVVINGVNADFTSDASGTKLEILNGIGAAIIALGQPVSVIGNGVDTFRLVANVAGVGFTVSVVNPATGVMTLTSEISNEISVEFGLLVVQDITGPVLGLNSDNKSHLPTTTTEISNFGSALGVAIHSHANEQALSPGVNLGYKTGSTMSIMKKGRIYVRVETPVVAGGTPFFRFNAPTNERLGACRTDTDGGNAVSLPTGIARFDSSVAAGELAILSLNIT